MLLISVMLYYIPYKAGIQAASFIQCYSTIFYTQQGYRLFLSLHCCSISFTQQEYRLFLISVMLYYIPYPAGTQAASFIQCCSTIFHLQRGYKLLPSQSAAPLQSISSRDTSCFLHQVLLPYIPYLSINQQGFISKPEKKKKKTSFVSVIVKLKNCCFFILKQLNHNEQFYD